MAKQSLKPYPRTIHGNMCFSVMSVKQCMFPCMCTCTYVFMQYPALRFLSLSPHFILQAIKAWGDKPGNEAIILYHLFTLHPYK